MKDSKAKIRSAESDHPPHASRHPRGEPGVAQQDCHARRLVAASRDAAHRSSLGLCVAILLLGMAGNTPAAETTPNIDHGAPPDPSRREMTLPETGSPWLDDVRAQREAWEARRDAARENFETRRRINHPSAAAHQEAWEDDIRRRRAARQERMDKDLEMFRSLGPESFPPPMRGAPMTSDGKTGGAGPKAPTDPMFPPPGWDNLWYFRGF